MITYANICYIEFFMQTKETKVIKITDKNSEETLTSAANMLKRGGLVVFPTETVYGLGANVFNEEALKEIFSAKGRPADNPLIVHISDQSEMKLLADNVSDLQQKLMDEFWPGPLTIIFQKKKDISHIVSGGSSTIAVRMPSHPIAQELIRQSSAPIAAPSANISGRPSSTTGEDAYKDLIGKVDMIIDAGQSDIGVESTVIKIEGDNIYILRPGAVTKEMIKKAAQSASVLFATASDDLKSSPGTRYKHYGPNAELILEEASKMEALALSLKKEGKAVGIITTDKNKNLFKIYEPNVFSLGDENNLEQISQLLYSALRFFDSHKVDVILCASFPKEGLGTAIMDRLTRAAGN
jgi:L-threonylcarbamoyladenylate synthase